MADPTTKDTVAILPIPPKGYEALRTGGDGSASLFGPHHPVQITHLIRGGKPSAGTLCGRTLFDTGDRKADIPGWDRGGGVQGPGITQERCAGCFAAAAKVEEAVDRG